MGREKTIINCGTTHVSAGRFQRSSEGELRMEGILRRELSHDYSVESDWLPAVAGALQDLAGEGGLNREATLIVPGFRVLSKIIEVPVVERSKQAQAIAFETQQNIPYPLSEVVWGYEIFADDGIEIEMVVVAEKLESSEEFCEEISKAGFSPEAVLPAPVLSYHTLLGTGAGGRQEEIVFIDVGARTSELLYMKGKELFIRSIALGGNFVTEYLARLTGESFSSAEERKVACFSEGREQTGANRFEEEMERSASLFKKRLSAEIGRSLASATGDKMGRVPRRMLLCGRGFRLPGLAEHLESSLNMKVESFSPADHVVPGKGIDVEKYRANLMQDSELIGAAELEKAGRSSTMNLLPESFARRQRLKRRKPTLVAAGLILAAAFALPVLHYRSLAINHERELGMVERELAPLLENEEAIARWSRQSADLAEEVEKIERILYSRSNWAQFFVDLQDRLHEVEDVWLEKLEIIREEESGLVAFDVEDVERLEGKGSKTHREGRIDRLRVVGRMLDRENPLAKVSNNVQQRVKRLLSKITGSAFISGVENIRFDTSDTGLLRFEFQLRISPDRPL